MEALLTTRLARHGFTIAKHGARNWIIHDSEGEIVAVTVYKVGAVEICTRLMSLADKLAALQAAA